MKAHTFQSVVSAIICRLQWPRGLRRRSAAAHLLRSWVRIPPASWMFVCCEVCVLSGRGLCDELITRPGESYRLWCVVVCDLGTSRMNRPWPALGRSATAKKKVFIHVSDERLIAYRLTTSVTFTFLINWILMKMKTDSREFERRLLTPPPSNEIRIKL